MTIYLFVCSLANRPHVCMMKYILLISSWIPIYIISFLRDVTCCGIVKSIKDYQTQTHSLSGVSRWHILKELSFENYQSWFLTVKYSVVIPKDTETSLFWNLSWKIYGSSERKDRMAFLFRNVIKVKASRFDTRFPFQFYLKRLLLWS